MTDTVKSFDRNRHTMQIWKENAKHQKCHCMRVNKFMSNATTRGAENKDKNNKQRENAITFITYEVWSTNTDTKVSICLNYFKKLHKRDDLKRRKNEDEYTAQKSHYRRKRRRKEEKKM